MRPPVETEGAEGVDDEVLEGVSLTGSDHKVSRLVKLQHPVHCGHVLGRPSPFASYREVAQGQDTLMTVRDSTGRRDNLLRDEPLGPQGALMVEQDSGACMKPVRLPVLGDLPEARGLGDTVGAAGPEDRLLVSP